MFSVEVCCGEERQPSSDAIISRISDTRLSRLESMGCNAPLGKLTLLPPSLPNSASDESLEPVFNPTSTEQLKLLPIHHFKHRHFVSAAASGCAADGSRGGKPRKRDRFAVHGRSEWAAGIIDPGYSVTYRLLNP